jgi:hypothetical protein
MQKYHMPNWEDSLFFKGQNRGRKGRKLTPSDEPTVPSVQASVHLVHCATDKMKTTLSDGPTIQFLDAPDELQRRSSEDSSTRWSDGLREDTIGLSDAQFKSRQRRAKAGASAPDEPTVGQRFIRRSRRYWQQGFGEESFSIGWSDAPSVYSVGAVVSADLQWLSDVEGTGWTDA